MSRWLYLLHNPAQPRFLGPNRSLNRVHRHQQNKHTERTITQQKLHHELCVRHLHNSNMARCRFQACWASECWWVAHGHRTSYGYFKYRMAIDRQFCNDMKECLHAAVWHMKTFSGSKSHICSSGLMQLAPGHEKKFEVCMVIKACIILYCIIFVLFR